MFWKNHWKSIVWAAFIMFVCAIPSDQVSKVSLLKIPHLDKVIHFILYFVFALLIISGNNALREKRDVTVNAIIWAAAITLSYGIVVEILQHFIFTTRSAEFWDIVANIFGFLAAAFAYRPANRITDGYL
jgi:VanZ family protein